MVLGKCRSIHINEFQVSNIFTADQWRFVGIGIVDDDNLGNSTFEFLEKNVSIIQILNGFFEFDNFFNDNLRKHLSVCHTEWSNKI